MIPKADIVGWRQVAPWISDAQVEQDLIISRTLVAMFENAFLAERLAFRGGTALHKLYLNPAKRFSEDIDLVQVESRPIGKTLDALQEALNVFLGRPRRRQKEGTVSLAYRMESEGPPAQPLRLKVEINTREHFTVSGLRKMPFGVRSRWFTGDCEVTTFTLEELLATKVRALYQRRKGRDLFDLWLGLTKGKANTENIVRIFKEYMKAEGHKINRNDYEKNVRAKMKHPGFTGDIKPLLPADVKYDVWEAFSLISQDVIARLDND